MALLLFSTLSDYVHGQQKEQPHVMSKEDYLRKSRRQQRTAWIMLGGGTVVAIGAMYWALESYANESGSGEHGQGYFFIAGACSIVGSIPVFIISNNTKKKAMSMSMHLENEVTHQLGAGGIKARHYPVVALRICL